MENECAVFENGEVLFRFDAEDFDKVWRLLTQSYHQVSRINENDITVMDAINEVEND